MGSASERTKAEILADARRFAVEDVGDGANPIYVINANVSIRSTAPVRRLDPAPTVVAGAVPSGGRTRAMQVQRRPRSRSSYAVGAVAPGDTAAAAAAARRAAAQRDGSIAGRSMIRIEPASCGRTSLRYSRGSTPASWHEPRIV